MESPWIFAKITVVFGALFCVLSLRAEASPQSLTYQGRILKSDGTPLEFNNVSFLFEIANPTGSCVIYREQVDGINMTNSNGIFDVAIGSGTRLWPTGPVYKISQAFVNSADHSCDGNTTYTALEDDLRVLKVQFHDGSGWRQISPSNIIRSVPFSHSAYTASKLGTLGANDFVQKTHVPGAACTAGQVITFDGTNFTCVTDAGGSGVISDVVAGTGVSVSGTTTKTVSVVFGSTAGTVAQGNDSRFSDSRTPMGAAGGDLGGTYPNPSVLKIQGVSVNVASPTAGEFLKYSGSEWVNSAIAIANVTNLATTLSGLQTTSAFNTAVGSANCANYETPYWNSVAGQFLCQAINVSVAGDVSGAIGAVSVNKIKGVEVDATAPTSGQVLKFDGAKWAPATDSSGTGTVTSVTAGTGLTGGTITGSGTIGLANTAVAAGSFGSATQVSTFTVDAQGRLTAAANVTISGVTPGGSAGGGLSGTYPNPTVAKIQSIAVSSTPPSAAGHILRYDGTTQYVPGYLNLSDIHSSVVPTSTAFPGVSCTAGQTLTWVSLNDTLACTTIAIDDSQVTYASKAANTFLAAPNGSAGAPTFRTIAAADLPVNAYDSTYFKNGGSSFGGSATLGTNDNNTLSFKTNNSTRMSIDTAGKVGIGTTTPGYTLDVQGTAKISGDAILPGGLTMWEDSSPNWQSTGAARWQSNGSMEIYTTDASQIISLGSNWATSFEVHPYAAYVRGSGAGATATLGAWGPKTSDNIYNFAGENLLINGGQSTGNAAGGYIAFATSPAGGSSSVNANAGVERMRISASGNVGIGTASPNSTLDVNGTIYATSVASSSYANVTASINSGSTGFWKKVATLPVSGMTGDLLHLKISGGCLGSGSKFSLSARMGNRGGFSKYVDHLEGNVTCVGLARVQAYDNAGLVTVYLYLPGTDYAHVGAELTNPGSWGTGATIYPNEPTTTTTPTGTLVFDTSTATASLVFSNYGYIGIGTTNPSGRLHVIGETDTGIGSNATILNAGYATDGFSLDTSGSSNTYYAAVIKNPSANGKGLLVDAGANDNSSGVIANFASNGASKLLIDEGGNVGIGTATPVARLDVNGGVRVGSDSSTCDNSKKGTTRYNSTENLMEYCNGTLWSDFSPSGAHCGYYSSRGSKACRGVVPSATCPSGYTRTQILVDDLAAGAAPEYYTCIKN